MQSPSLTLQDPPFLGSWPSRNNGFHVDTSAEHTCVNSSLENTIKKTSPAICSPPEGSFPTSLTQSPPLPATLSYHLLSMWHHLIYSPVHSGYIIHWAGRLGAHKKYNNMSWMRELCCIQPSTGPWQVLRNESYQCTTLCLHKQRPAKVDTAMIQKAGAWPVSFACVSICVCKGKIQLHSVLQFTIFFNLTIDH